MSVTEHWKSPTKPHHFTDFFPQDNYNAYLKWVNNLFPQHPSSSFFFFFFFSFTYKTLFSAGILWFTENIWCWWGDNTRVSVYPRWNFCIYRENLTSNTQFTYPCVIYIASGSEAEWTLTPFDVERSLVTGLWRDLWCLYQPVNGKPGSKARPPKDFKAL